jgi:hypothetical protein
MSTESSKACAAAAAGVSTVLQGDAGTASTGGDDRATHLADAEAAAAEAVATAQQAAAAAQAAVAAAAALRLEMEREDATSAGSRSCSPNRRRELPSPEQRRGRRQRSPACTPFTVTPEPGCRGRCSPRATTTSGVFS